MTAGPVTSTAAWEDANAVSPPAIAVSATQPQYSQSLAANSTSVALIYEGGISLTTQSPLVIPYTYLPGTNDSGASMNVSINSGSTWTTQVMAVGHQAVAVTGSMSVPLTGGTVLIVQVSSP